MQIEEILQEIIRICKNNSVTKSEARERDMSDSFVLSGTSAKFSITFDVAWKVMKDILVQYYATTGFVAGSPREVQKRVEELLAEE